MKTHMTFKMASILLLALGMAACHSNQTEPGDQENDSAAMNEADAPFVLKHMEVDRQQIMSHVTCSSQTVDSLLAIADTVYSATNNYKLENLGMGSRLINNDIKEAHGDTIPIVVALFDSHARMVNSGMDEANAAFVWHDVAKAQMKAFYETTPGGWSGPEGYEALFNVISNMMGVYSCGSQTDMNDAAWRAAMPIDFRLIDAYKQLEDLCGPTTVVKLVHDDYLHMLRTFREYCSSSDEWYSCLPMEQGAMFQGLLESKTAYVRQLADRYGKGQITRSMVRKGLKEHRIRLGNEDVELTVALWSDE